MRSIDDARTHHNGSLKFFKWVKEGSRTLPRLLQLAPQPQLRALSRTAWVLRCPAWERMQAWGHRHCKATLEQICQALVWQGESAFCLISPCTRLRSLLCSVADASNPIIMTLAGAGLASGSSAAAPAQPNSMQVRQHGHIKALSDFATLAHEHLHVVDLVGRWESQSLGVNPESEVLS